MMRLGSAGRCSGGHRNDRLVMRRSRPRLLSHAHHTSQRQGFRGPRSGNSLHRRSRMVNECLTLSARTRSAFGHASCRSSSERTPLSLARTQQMRKSTVCARVRRRRNPASPPPDRGRRRRTHKPRDRQPWPPVPNWRSPASPRPGMM
jgi:hypothetical protein